MNKQNKAFKILTAPKSPLDIGPLDKLLVPM